MLFPNPQQYKDWKDWAVKLMDALKKKEPLTIPAYTVATVPFPDKDNLLIIVTNETGGRTLAVSFGGVFKRVKDGATIA